MRVLVVCNKDSSRFGQIREEVLDRLKPGFEVFYVDTSRDVDENAKELLGCLRSGDRVVSAGGDGTAAICVNALAGAEARLKDLSLAVLPYGNFNDIAHTFGRPEIERIEDERAETVAAHALDLRLDGEHRRFSLGYFTIGMFAESTKIFDRAEVRKRLKNYRGSRLVFSIVTLIGWWVKNRKRRFLPRRFLLGNSREIEVKNATDYMAVNTTRVAKLMRNRRKFYEGEEFLSSVNKGAGIWGIGWFMARSVMWQMPGKESACDIIRFDVEVSHAGDALFLDDAVLDIDQDAVAANAFRVYDYLLHGLPLYVVKTEIVVLYTVNFLIVLLYRNVYPLSQN